MSTVSKREAMAKAVEEVKLARQEALREEESDTEMTSEPNSRHQSLVPSGGCSFHWVMRITNHVRLLSNRYNTEKRTFLLFLLFTIRW